MRLRRLVRIGGWGIIVGVPLISLFPIWQSFGWAFEHDAIVDLEEAISIIVGGALPFILMVFVAFAVGGSCLLIADIHERHLEGGR